STAHARAALPTHGVDFVNENDAGRVFMTLLEEIADATRADADEHFHKVRTADAEERHTRFASHSAGQEGLARSGRTHEEHAPGDLAAEAGKFLGLLEKLDDLVEFFLGLVHAGDITEGNGLVTLIDHARATFAEGHGLVVAAL